MKNFAAISRTASNRKTAANFLALSAVSLLMPGPRARGAEVEWKRKVFLPDGQPAVGVKVLIQAFAEPNDTASFRVKPSRTTITQEFTTDENGILNASARMNGEHGGFRLIVDAPGAALMFSDVGLGNQAETKRTITMPLRLSAAYTLHGRVLRQDGRPVANAKISITFLNTGTATWTAAEKYFFGAQTPENNQTWGSSRVPVAANLPSGQQAIFSFDVKAPVKPGTYNFQWRILQEGVAWCGDYTPNVAVVVK